MASAVTFGAIFLTIPYMSRPTIDMADHTFVVAIASSQEGGSLWVSMKTANPIDLESRREFQLTINIASDRDVAPTLVFGGLAATSLRACEGVGAFMDRGAPLTAFDELSAHARDLLVDYAQNVPSTREVAEYSSNDKMAVEAAMDLMGGLKYRVDEVELARAEERVWEYSDEAHQRYDVRAATLTCTFDWSALLEEKGGAFGFAAPDIIAGVADLADEGPIRVDYDFQVANTSGYTRSVSTFVAAREFVDTSSNQRVVSFNGNWWKRNDLGERAILLSGGTVIFEPGSAPLVGVIARLLATLCASLSLTLMLIVIRRTADRVRVLQ